MEENIVPKVLMAPLYHLEVVKDRDIPYEANVRTTEAAAQVLHNLLDRSPTENMAVVYLNSSSEIIGAERVGMGGLEAVGNDPTEIFRGALVKAAPELLLAHNHPSGDVKPSPQDLLMTMNNLSLGGILGIRVRDHIVVGPNGKHFSIREGMVSGSLKDEIRRAEEIAYGPHIGDLKEKIIDMIKQRGIKVGGPLDALDMPPGTSKKGGDPKANLVSDWEDSLTWLYLHTRF